MSGGGGKEQKDPYRHAKTTLGEHTQRFLGRDFENFDTATRAERAAYGRDVFGSELTPELESAIASGGYVGLTGNQLDAIGGFQGMLGGDAGFGAATSAFQNNRGINQLAGINYGQLQGNAERALQNFDPTALRGFNPSAQQGFNASSMRGFDPSAQRAVNFNALQQQDPSNQYLRQVGSGQFLTPDSNPFLRGAVEASQRPVLEAYQQQIAPQLAAQFGGGFGVGGSASMNAQRLAAEGVSRNLADSATRAYAGAYQQERGLMDTANRFLSGQQLQRGQALGQLQLARGQGIDASRFARAQGIDQSMLSRAQGIDQSRLARAQGIDSSRLARGQALAQSGLGFTQGRIAGGSALAGAQNQRAAGLANIASARGAQRLAAAQGILGAGTLEQQTLMRGADIARGQFDAERNPDLIKMQLISPLLMSGGMGPTGASRNRTAGAMGGALGGAATGAAVGSAVPGIGTAIGALGGAVIGGVGGYYA